LGDFCGDRWTISPSTSRIFSQVCQYFIDEEVAEEKWNIVIYWAIWLDPSCQYLVWVIYHWYMRRVTVILPLSAVGATDSHDELLFCFHFMRFWDFGIRGPRNGNCSESILLLPQHLLHLFLQRGYRYGIANPENENTHIKFGYIICT